MVMNILKEAKDLIYIVAILCSVALTIINFLKSNGIIKAKNNRVIALEKTLDTTNSVCQEACKRIEILQKVIPEAMKQAEAQPVTGEAKKTLALAYIIQKCSELNINYNSISKEVSDTIESNIQLTKAVNYIDLNVFDEMEKETNVQEKGEEIEWPH